MKIQSIYKVVAALVLCAMLVPFTVQPAKANTTSTLLIAGAAAALLLTASNVASKNAKANTVEGYLPDGAVVYADGHVVEPNGQSWYPGNQGEQVACNGQSCFISNGYNTGYNGGYNNNGGYDSYYRGNRNGGWRR